MSDIKFKFTVQQYQTDAVNSVVNVFKGQPYTDGLSYLVDTGAINNGQVEMHFDSDNKLNNISDELTGFSNARVTLKDSDILTNIQRIQADNNIKISDELVKPVGACSLDVEMETGTGKTYVYIKTMLELNRQYGWSKYVVVVPSKAILEGVKKSFDTMEEHFFSQYHKTVHSFIYNSANMTDIRDFSTSSDIYVMIITMQSFNSSFDKDKKNKATRVIFTERDEFNSRMPMEVIAANHPIIIMDEPQKMGGKATQKALLEFKPLFVLNYSATHKEEHNKVYVLDPVDAYQQKLVKKIAVKGIEKKNLTGTEGYMYLEEIILDKKNDPRARMEIEIKNAAGVPKRKTVILSKNDDLYVKSNGLEEYHNGYVITDILPKQKEVTFTEHKIFTGDINTNAASKEESDRLLRTIQIRETVRSHFKKEQENFKLGIKTLSLFFIDEVSKYRKYDDNGNEMNSEYGDIFESEYNAAKEEALKTADPDYAAYLSGIDTSDTHAGYFSIDKHGHKVNSSVKRGSDTSDDESAYDLIMKDKEKLLSFDNPVRFIFSHSALREGWDNPNVFQICTLKDGGDSTTNKRQEVGRGLRLCVNQSGDRMDANILGDDVQKVNRLTVISSENYETFVKTLQKQTEEDMYDRPRVADVAFFENKRVTVGDRKIAITHAYAQKIHDYLLINHYRDSEGHILDKYRIDAENGNLAPFDGEYKDLAPMADGIQKLIQGIYDDKVFEKIIDDENDTKIEDNKLNQNFSKAEFQALWKKINHKYTYTVSFDTNELIRRSIDEINDKLHVSKTVYTVTEGEQSNNWNQDTIRARKGFISEARSTLKAPGSGSRVKYDLIGKIKENTRLTRRTVASILMGINQYVFEMFNDNPEEFIANVSRLINNEKAKIVVDDITYNRLADTYDASIFTAERYTDFSRAYKSQKNVQDYVFADGSAKDGRSVERVFAETMDQDDKVIVYAKLPRGFQIPTPVGNYAPDWAIVLDRNKVKHIYFVAETKGTKDTSELRGVEENKIKCVTKLFEEYSSDDVKYEQVTSFDDLLEAMELI